MKVNYNRLSIIKLGEVVRGRYTDLAADNEGKRSTPALHPAQSKSGAFCLRCQDRSLWVWTWHHIDGVTLCYEMAVGGHTMGRERVAIDTGYPLLSAEKHLDSVVHRLGWCLKFTSEVPE